MTASSGRLFLDFFYALRHHGVVVSTHNWLALLESLAQGLHGDSLDGFYQVARCLLVGNESDYDAFDRAFLQTFKGIESEREVLLDHIQDWLANPKELLHLDPAIKEALKNLDADEIRKQLLERLAEQKGRHEGGNRWIGTGGTSPFGQGGYHPTGVRIGGKGGSRSALAVADERRFKEFRKDLVLDTRQIAAALRKLRRLSRSGQEEELDIDATIHATARSAGDLEIVLQPPRKNDVRMLLLLDVGGSMDAHAALVSRLFSAAFSAGGFRELKHYYFHNCIYSTLYEDAAFSSPIALKEIMNQLNSNWYVVVVGDAWMHPGELMMNSGSFWHESQAPSGIECLATLANAFPKSAWINPESKDIWRSPSVAQVHRIFPMYHLSLEGLDEMVDGFRRPRSQGRKSMIQTILNREGG